MPYERKTVVMMPEFDNELGAAQLNLHTYKPFSRGILSHAGVSYTNADGHQQYVMYADYSSNIRHDRTARASEKAINQQHNAAFDSFHIELIKDAARTFYANLAILKR